MLKVGVTGGNGFIGTEVRHRLRALGHEVMLFDRHIKGGENQLVGQFFLGDVTNEKDVFEFAAHVDGIIHLAAVLGTQETIQNPLPSAVTNIHGSLNVFEAASRYSLPVVYAGVGNHFMRMDGTGSYTISKSCAEDYARMYNHFRGGNIAIVRPVNAYGPGQSIAAPYGPSKVRKIMPAFICRALVGEPIEIYGDGEQVSDCVHVLDVANTFARALEATQRAGSPIPLVEVGPAVSCSVNEVAELVRTHVATVTGRDPVDVQHVQMRPGETPNAVVQADVSTLKHVGLDARDFISLNDGIKHTVDYFYASWLPKWSS